MFHKKISGIKLRSSSPIEIKPSKKFRQLIFDLNIFVEDIHHSFSFIDHHEAGIFHLAHNYELISVSDEIIPESVFFQYLDPFSCISYKVFSRNLSNVIFPKNSIIITDDPTKFDVQTLFTTSKDIYTIYEFLVVNKTQDLETLLYNYNSCDFVSEYQKDCLLDNLFIIQDNKSRFVESYDDCKRSYLAQFNTVQNKISTAFHYLKYLML